MPPVPWPQIHGQASRVHNLNFNSPCHMYLLPPIPNDVVPPLIYQKLDLAAVNQALAFTPVASQSASPFRLDQAPSQPTMFLQACVANLPYFLALRSWIKNAMYWRQENVHFACTICMLATLVIGAVMFEKSQYSVQSTFKKTVSCRTGCLGYSPSVCLM